MQLDQSTEFGARVARRLESEHVAWLTTVRADGQPQPSPVWFLWDGDSILIYSRPNQPKLRNIAGNPKVSLSFNSDGDGGDGDEEAGPAWMRCQGTTRSEAKCGSGRAASNAMFASYYEAPGSTSKR